MEWDIADNLIIPEWSSDDFVALKTHKKHYEKLTNTLLTLKLKPGKIFANKEGNMIAVFEFIKNK
ncbi:MAG: hypothetical protein GAS50_10815 [Desulfobacterales bacterium]|nr:hypothetical protein [Desulfobacterales bacterium]